MGKTKAKSKNKAKKDTVNVEKNITNPAELKEFLLDIRDRMLDKSSAIVYSLSCLNYIFTLPDIYSLLDETNREIARDIWLHLKQSGLKVSSPPLLFDEYEISGVAS